MLFIVLKNFVFTDYFKKIDNKLISTTEGYIIYYIQLLAYFLNIMINYICFYWIIRDQYKEDELLFSLFKFRKWRNVAQQSRALSHRILASIPTISMVGAYFEPVKHLEVGADGILYLSKFDKLVGRVAAAALAGTHLHGGEGHQGLVAQGGAAEWLLAQGHGLAHQRVVQADAG